MKWKTAVLMALFLAGCGQGTGHFAADGVTHRVASDDPGEDSSSVVLRRVWASDADLDQTSPSPDGRYLVHTQLYNGNSGALALRDLATGETRLITSKRPEGVHSMAFSGRFSRDGQRIAYLWWEGPEYRRELRVIAADGSGERSLYRTDERRGPWINVADWSPDGRHILVGLRDVNWAWQLALISAEDGSIQVLKSLGWRFPGSPSFSPDGRYVAYDFPPEETSAKRDIYIIARDGSHETRVTGTSGNERLMGWAPDGRSLFFRRDEHGSRSVWQVSVADGKRTGAERLVRSDVWGMSPLGLSGDKLYYLVHNKPSEIYSAQLDVETGRMLAPPTQMFHVPGWLSLDLSPDGAHAAYFAGGENDGVGPISLFIRSLATGEERELEIALDYIWSLRWSPDGQSILAIAQKRGRDELYRIDLKTRSVAPLGYEGAVSPPISSPDGKTEYYGRGGENHPPAIIARDVATGVERVLYDGPARPWMQLSPDGSRLATTLERSDTIDVLAIPTAGGEPRVVLRGLASEKIDVSGWTRDGRHILFVRHADGEGRLWKVPVGGGEPQPLPLKEKDGFRHLVVHAGGQRILYTVRRVQPTELWVMENLPESSPSAKPSRSR